MSSKVYFTKDISPEGVVKVYRALGTELGGRVAVKVHSGEKGNQNFLTPDFWKPVFELVGGTAVECNTAYNGERNVTERHKRLMEYHGWSKYFDVDILDAEGPDKVLDIPYGKRIKKNYVGKDIENYDSMLVLSHFKGHPMGGYGGALKQLRPTARRIFTARATPKSFGQLTTTAFLSRWLTRHCRWLNISTANVPI